MDKFLELALVNYIRNYDEISDKIDKCYDTLVGELRKLLSKDVCDNLEDILGDCQSNAMYLAGLAGMELAIGVMNGTIEQKIEA